MSTIKAGTKLVKSHFAVVLKQERKNLIDFVTDELKDLDLCKLKLDPDFIKYVCDLIENQVTAPTDTSVPKTDKMETFIEILKRLHPSITDADIDVAKGIAEFLLMNKMIKKVGISEVMKYYLQKKFFST